MVYIQKYFNFALSMQMRLYVNLVKVNLFRNDFCIMSTTFSGLKWSDFIKRKSVANFNSMRKRTFKRVKKITGNQIKKRKEAKIRPSWEFFLCSCYKGKLFLLPNLH